MNRFLTIKFTVQTWYQYKLGNAPFQHSPDKDVSFFSLEEAQDHVSKADIGTWSDTRLQYKIVPEIVAKGSEEWEHGIFAHMVVEDPRYPLLCFNGKFIYGLRMNPKTGELDRERQCICAAHGDYDCICTL